MTVFAVSLAFFSSAEGLFALQKAFCAPVRALNSPTP